MNFILPNMFEAAIDELRAIFKVKTDSAATLLSRERISRAKKMMIPFVLRRRKDQVLKDLPKKKERVEYCTLSDIQSTIYREAMLRSRKIVLESAPDTPETMSSNEDSGAETKKKKSKPLQKKLLSKDTSSNVLMDLRKAALHPMLFRRRFTDGDLDKMTKVLLKQPDFVKRGAVYELVKEDMEVMTDSELQRFCQTSKVGHGV
jgi:SWI/SNF-related matrix-associated actin-dependent regulator 1 of chromatin subfamily A